MKLNVKAFALAAGIIWAIGVLFVLLIPMYSSYLGEFSALIVDSYPGSGVSYGGAIIGAIWGFFDALIGCAIFAWLYNKLA